jgi:hypothetical protein
LLLVCFYAHFQRIGRVSYKCSYGDQRELPQSLNVQRTPLDAHALREKFQTSASKGELTIFYCSQEDKGVKEYSNRLKDENVVLSGDDGKFE